MIRHFLLLAAFSASLVSAQTLLVTGDVAHPGVLKAEDLAALPHETVTIPEQDGAKVAYEGVALREILQRAGAPLGQDLRGKALTTYILAKAKDGYAVVYTLGELDAQLGNATILVADKRDGKPLSEYQGPLRLICPNDKAGGRSVRMLESIEVVRLAK